MPRVGFLCDGNEEKISFDDCKKCATRGKMLCNRDPAIVLGTLKIVEEYIPTKRDRPSLSVTDLTAVCHRRTYLQEKYDYREKPSDLRYLWRGNLVHEMLSKVENKNWIKEQKFAIPHKIKLFGEDVEVFIVGKPDVIDILNKEIRDYKTTGSVFSATKVISLGYKWQLGIYRWIVKKSHLDLLCTSYYDTFIDMKIDRMINIPIINFGEVEKYIQKQGSIILDFRTNNNVPSVIKKFPMHWLCKDFCSVNHICSKLYYEKGVK